MSKTVVIRGHRGQVHIEVANYARPDSTTGMDANWLACKCEVAVQEFSCNLNLSLTTADFVQFLAELDVAFRLLKGTAVFATLEGGLKLEIIFKTAGHVDVFGSVRSQISSRRRTLSFAFESDQSFLSQTLDGLRAVVRQFPVRGEL